MATGSVLKSLSGGYWVAQMNDGQKDRFVGRFETETEAAAALEAKLASLSIVQGGPEEASSEGQATVEGDGATCSEVSIDEVVSEALRNLVCQVVLQASSPPLPATYERPPSGAVRLCRFGSTCMRLDVSHFMIADHPSDHPRLGQPAPPRPPFSLASLSKW